MAGDTRDIRINVKVDSDTRGSTEAAAGLEKVDKSAGKAEDGLLGLRKESEKLDVQITKSKARVKELEEQLVKTADRATGRGSLRGQLNSERSWLRELERTAKNLGPTVSKGLLDSLSDLNLPMGISGQAAGIGAVVVAAAAPALSAGLSAAVLGGVGLGGVVGGAVLAARDERVKHAWSDLGHGIVDGLRPAQDAFVEPMVNAAHILGDAFTDSGFTSQLEKAAALVEPLARGIGGFGENLSPGLGRAFEGALPVIQTLERELPRLGTSFSGFFDDLADAGPEAGLAMKDFFRVLEKGVDVTGEVTKALAKVYPVIRPLIDFVPMFGLAQVFADLDKDVTPTLHGIGEAAPAAGAGLQELGADAEGAAEKFDKLRQEQKDLLDQFERQIDLQASLLLDNIDLEQGLQDLADTLDENGATLDINTDKGRENQRALIDLAKGIREVRDDQIALGGSTADANATLAANKEKLLEQAEAAGLSRVEVEKLIDQLLRVPVIYGDIAAARTYSQGTAGGEGRKAAGGPVTAGVSYLVGEHRAEVFTPRSNGYITPSVDKWLAGGMGGGGGGVQTIRFEVGGSPNGLFEMMFVDWLTKYVSVSGGDGSAIGIKTVRG